MHTNTYTITHAYPVYLHVWCPQVSRVNHTGDWGTQFGMLITHMKTEYPDLFTNPPNIQDLTTYTTAPRFESPLHPTRAP